MATATKVIGGLASKLADLRGQRVDLTAEAARPSPLDQVDQEIETTRAEMAAVQAKANHDALIELRKAERDQMLKVIAAADALWKEIEQFDPIWKEQAQVAPGAGHLAVIPYALIQWLRPGWHGGRRQWAHTKKFAAFEYTK